MVVMTNDYGTYVMLEVIIMLQVPKVIVMVILLTT